jgi:hypothetical protein
VTLGNASPDAHWVGEVLVWKVINDLMGVGRANRFDWKENLVRGEIGAKERAGQTRVFFKAWA